MAGLKDPDRPKRRQRWLWWWPLGVLAIATVLVLGVSGAKGGFTAKIANTGDLVQSGSLVTAATSGASSECDLSTAAYSPITANSNTASCSGTLAPSGTLAASASSATATTLTEKGSLASSAGLTEGVCGPVQLANATAATDPMLIRGTTVSFAQAGPTSLSGSAGLGLSGTSGYAADVSSSTAPSTYTELIWFKTTTSGSLMGFTDTPSVNAPTTWDRMLWIDSAGHVVFGTHSTLSLLAPELTTTGTYNNGAWHFAAVSFGTLSGISLSVDGGTPITSTTLTSAAYSGYWHVGWDNQASGYTNPPSNPYFAGSLADAAVFPSVLTTAQITALYSQSTQAGFAALVSSDTPTDFWPLGDNGTGVYTGTVPKVSPAACAFVDATIGVGGASTTCAAPVSASACAAPTSGTTLASLAAKTTSFAVGPSASQALSVTVTLARDATNKVATYPDAVGLHLSSVLGLAASAGSFSATLTWPAENIIL